MTLLEVRSPFFQLRSISERALMSVTCIRLDVADLLEGPAAPAQSFPAVVCNPLLTLFPVAHLKDVGRWCRPSVSKTWGR